MFSKPTHFKEIVRKDYSEEKRIKYTLQEEPMENHPEKTKGSFLADNAFFKQIKEIWFKKPKITIMPLIILKGI